MYLVCFEGQAIEFFKILFTRLAAVVGYKAQCLALQTDKLVQLL